MSSWLANATGVHISPHKSYIDRKQLGSAVGHLAPLAAAFIPGLQPLAIAGIGAAGAAAGKAIQPGSNFGDILGAGARGGATSYAGAKIAKALGYGGTDAANQASSTATDAAGDVGEEAIGAAERFGTQGTKALDAVHPMAGLKQQLASMPFADKLALGSTALQGIGGVAGGIAQGQQAQFERDKYNEMAPIRQQAMQQLGGQMQAPTPFQFQSPFAQQQPQSMPGAPQGQGLDPASQWAAILKARGLPGLSPGGR
ncbi:MAG: hypothetical protein ACR652_24690 [Methylocystis sp.]|uniref:hypothetical protein n=1 Tax=Methylocystis sp. TaxID=1911079 RepID=UPI003DA42F05